jgi:hypothetical protein
MEFRRQSRSRPEFWERGGSTNRLRDACLCLLPFSIAAIPRPVITMRGMYRALSGRVVRGDGDPGRCPGLRDDALLALTLRARVVERQRLFSVTKPFSYVPEFLRRTLRYGICPSCSRAVGFDNSFMSASIMISINSRKRTFGSQSRIFFAFAASPMRRSTSAGRS